MDLSGQHFVVWGLGRTGTETAVFLSKRGAKVTILDSGVFKLHRQQIEKLPTREIAFVWESQGLDSWRGIDCILLSPGVPYDLPALKRARALQIPTLAAMDWCAQFVEIPIVAVTGSMGKSTTVTCVGEMLRCSGKRPFVGGNLGTPLAIYLQEPEAYDYVVLECSSFQLEACAHLSPDIAVFTNIAPNHLDRHGDMQTYLACKLKMCTQMSEEGMLIWNTEDETLEGVKWPGLPEKLRFGWNALEEGAFMEGDQLVLRRWCWGEERYDLRDIALLGRHNRENIMAAALAARCAGATSEAIRLALRKVRGLPHRLERVGCWHGVAYFNDS
ncbi:MAG: UDP-N-acetylmuramoyl-L-alanine--D-glutamate ligase, partial [Myxococcota bacterium]